MSLVATFSTCFIIAFVLNVAGIPTVALSAAPGNKDEILDTAYPILIEEMYDASSSSSSTAYSSKSFFGYTVSLAKGIDRTNHPEGWIFIGAPKSNTSTIKYAQDGKDFEPGAMWRCSLGRASPRVDSCEMMDIDPPFDSKRRPGNPQVQSHDGAWIGVSSEINHDRFVTCGMRWNRGKKQYYNGICYWFGDIENSQKSSYRTNDLRLLVDKSLNDQRLIPFFRKDKEEERLFNFTNRQNKFEQGHEWQLSQAGVSIHLFLDEKLGPSPNLLIGAPGVRQWAGAVVLYTNPETPRNGMDRPNRNKNDPTFSEFLVLNRGGQPDREERRNQFHWDEYFGYSVSAGKYRSKTEVLYAAGAPRADHCGAVVVFNYPPYQAPTATYKRQIKPIVSITAPKNSFASYFGSVIHSADFDGNGLDELIVGAPLFTLNLRDSDTLDGIKERYEASPQGKGEKSGNSQELGDHGCVFVYKFNSTEADLKDPVQTLFGSKSPRARFGSAISTITFNLHSNTKEVYLVIGAPFEYSDDGSDSSGAIYLYLYDKEAGKFDTYSQRITASRISKSLNGFGSSLSIPEDVDMNNTPDLAVGAFKSGHAVVLRTRTKILLKSWMKFESSEDAEIQVIQRGTTSFYLQSCYSVEETLGLVANKVDIWTKVKFTDPTIKFDDRHVNERLGNAANEITYFRTVDAHKSRTCEKIKILSVNQEGIGIDDSDTIKEDVNPFTFTQEVWYNETLHDPDDSPEVLQIFAEKPSVQPQTQNSNFNSFRSRLPTAQVSTSVANVPVSLSDCRDKVCRPELSLAWSFYHPRSKNESMTSYVLGSSQELITQLVILNTGETAVRPKITLDYNFTAISESVSGNRWLHKNCKDVPESTSKIFETCHLGQYIKKGRNVTIRIHFKVDNIFVKDPESIKFIINAKVNFEDRHIEPVKSSGWLQLQVPTTMATITGSTDNEILRGPISYYITKFEKSHSTITSEHRNSDILYSPFRQRFAIVIQGASVDEAVATFKIPVSWNGQDDTTKQMFIVRQPQVHSMNIECQSTSSKFGFHMIEVINPGSPPGPEDVSVKSRDASHTHNFYSIEEATVVRRRRDIPSQMTESSNNATPASQQQNGNAQISQDNLLPKSRAKQRNAPPKDSLHFMCTSEAYCLDVKCTIKNVKANIPIRIPFEVFPIKESIDNLLKTSGKSVLFLEATGSVEIFPKSTDRSHYQDGDMAQTTLSKISGRVESWVYFAAAGSAILLLACIIVGLYMCGFFKRQKRQELNHLKAEHHRKSMMAAARASMMIQPTSASADGFESRENLTEAEHHNEYTEPAKSQESEPTPSYQEEKRLEAEDHQ